MMQLLIWTLLLQQQWKMKTKQLPNLRSKWWQEGNPYSFL